MLESTVEERYCRRVKRAKGRAYKFVSPGVRGVPDRLVLYPIPEEHRELVAKYVQFTELKAPGEKPRPEQIREHKRLRRLGYKVEVVDG